MDSSSTSNKRSMESPTAPIAKRRCDQAQSLSLNHGLFKTHYLSGESLYESFKRLSDSDQRVYFETLGSFPRIDRMVLQHYDKEDRFLTEAELEATDKLQDKVQNIWSSAEPDPKLVGQRQKRVSVRWSDSELHWNPETQQFGLRDAQLPNERYSSEQFENSLRERGFLYHISSSLLFYRLNLLLVDFQSTPTDRYKSCWDVRFYHADGITSLRLWDSRGGIEARFSGSKQSQNDALELINLLTTYKFPHTYNGLVAGTLA